MSCSDPARHTLSSASVHALRDEYTLFGKWIGAFC
jgi:hypothetical protein